MKTTLVAALLCILPLAAASALDEEHRALVQEFFELSSQKEQFTAGMLAGFDATANAEQFKALPEEQRRKALKGLAKVREYLVENVTWESIEPSLVEVYAKTFTKEELKAVIPALRKPEMRTFFRRQIEVVGPATKVSMKIMADLQPEIARIMTEAMTKP